MHWSKHIYSQSTVSSAFLLLIKIPFTDQDFFYWSRFLLLIKIPRRVMKNKEGVAEEDVEEMISGVYQHLYMFYMGLYVSGLCVSGFICLIWVYMTIGVVLYVPHTSNCLRNYPWSNWFDQEKSWNVNKYMRAPLFPVLDCNLETIIWWNPWRNFLQYSGMPRSTKDSFHQPPMYFLQMHFEIDFLKTRSFK